MSSLSARLLFCIGKWANATDPADEAYWLARAAALAEEIGRTGR